MLKRLIFPVISLTFSLLLVLLARPTLSQATLYTAAIDYSNLSSVLVQDPPAQLRLPNQLVSTTPLPVDIYYGTGGITGNVRNQVTGYAVNIQADPQTCRGALSCTDAYVDVTAINSSSPSIQEQYGPFYDSITLSRIRNAGHAPFNYQLSNRQSVTILPWTEAGAGMGYEKGVWDECDSNNLCYRYVVGLKGGDADALIVMLKSIGANSRRDDGNSGGIVSGDWSQLINPTDPRGQ